MSELIKTISAYPWTSLFFGIFIFAIVTMILVTISEINYTKNKNNNHSKTGE